MSGASPTTPGTECAGDAELARALAALALDRPRSFLVVYDHVPRPDASGADLRLVQIVELLRAAGHAVTLIGRNADSGPEHAQRLVARGVRVIAPDPERMPFAPAGVPGIGLEALLASAAFDCALLYQYFWSGIGVGEQYLPLLRRHAPATRVLLLSDDCHALREERRAEKSGARNDLERARGLLEKERDSYRLADALWTITAEDAGRMRTQWPELAPFVVPFAQAEVRDDVPGFEQRDGLMFLGSGANDANLQAVRWFVRDVLPHVRVRLPGVRLCLVGEPPPADAGGWGFDGDPAIETVGRAAELAPHFDRARVFVSPVTYGTGLKTKNVQALGHGLPLVLTAISAEGLELGGELARSVQDDPCAFADAVVELHTDRARWERSSAASRAHARARFGRARTADALAQALAAALSRPPKLWPDGHVGPSFRVEARLGKRRSMSQRTLAHLDLARELAREQDLPAAIGELRTALCDLVFVDSGAPAFGDLHAQLALFYSAANEPAECAAAADAALAQNPDLAPDLRAAVERARDRARDELARAPAEAPEDPRLTAAAERFGRGALDEAAELLLAVLGDDPRSARAWNDLGVVLWTGGEPAEALHAFENALHHAPDDPDALANRARVLADAGRAVEPAPVRG